jgi:methylated-DNA-[protein]-cysteine S-methyltransferase
MSNASLLVFPSKLGWMAVIVAGNTVRGLTFGHRWPVAAKKALGELGGVKNGTVPFDALVQRLQAFAAGQPDSFLDIQVDLGRSSDFQRRILTHCRHIPYGKTITYAELAAQAGSRRAARAVGRSMATNRIPLIIPCHRVIRSDGQVGDYSAPGGGKMKRRLLKMESQNWPRIK